MATASIKRATPTPTTRMIITRHTTMSIMQVTLTTMPKGISKGLMDITMNRKSYGRQKVRKSANILSGATTTPMPTTHISKKEAIMRVMISTTADNTRMSIMINSNITIKMELLGSNKSHVEDVVVIPKRNRKPSVISP